MWEVDTVYIREGNVFSICSFVVCIMKNNIFCLWYLVVIFQQEKSFSILYEILRWSWVQVFAWQSWELSNLSWVEQSLNKEPLESNKYCCIMNIEAGLLCLARLLDLDHWRSWMHAVWVICFNERESQFRSVLAKVLDL